MLGEFQWPLFSLLSGSINLVNLMADLAEIAAESIQNLTDFFQSFVNANTPLANIAQPSQHPIGPFKYSHFWYDSQV